jgi:hypothetical protein
MRTIDHIEVGDMWLVRRSDGGIYLARPDRFGVMDREGMIRVGSSAAICSALAEAFTNMAKRIREGDTPAPSLADEDAEELVG